METKMTDKLYGALDLGGSFLKYAYGNSRHGIIYDGRLQVMDATNNSCLLEVIHQAIQEIRAMRPDIDSFGMGSPGTVNVNKGMVTGVTPNLPELVKLELKKEIEARDKINIHIENDANLMAYAEASLYPGQSVLGITIGTGIGSGFVNENGIFHGQDYSALEIGHSIVELDGRQCKCGKKGCVEAYSSATSVMDICAETFPEIQFETIADLYQKSQQNVALNQKIRELNRFLALGIANTIMVLNPAVVCIGGGVVDIDSYDFEYLRKEILDLLMGNYKTTLISKAHFGNRAGIYGGLLIAESCFLEHNLL